MKTQLEKRKTVEKFVSHKKVRTAILAHYILGWYFQVWSKSIQYAPNIIVIDFLKNKSQSANFSSLNPQ